MKVRVICLSDKVKYDEEHYDSILRKTWGDAVANRLIYKTDHSHIKTTAYNHGKYTENVLLGSSKVKSDGGSSDYYKLPEYATELKHLISHKKMNFNVGNIFKAAYRLGEKEGNDLRYDLKKILFFAQSELDELDRIENEG